MHGTKLMRTIAAALGATLLLGGASIAYSHEGDVHHWFDHERARTVEGGPLPVYGTASPSNGANGGNGANGAEAGLPDCLLETLKGSEGYVPRPCTDRRAAAEPRRVVDGDAAGKRRLAQALPDCLMETLKAGEGYVPRPCTDRPAEADQRWVVDEDKQRGRHAEQALAR